MGRPANQFVSVACTSGSGQFTASVAVGSTFIGVSPPVGTATVGSKNNVQVFITDTGLSMPPGTYNGAVTITIGSQSFQVLVMFTVGPGSGGGSGVTASASTLDFNLALGGMATSQPVTLSTSGVAVSVTAMPMYITSNNSNWLSVSPASGTVSTSSPLTLNVTATPGNLPAGTYQAYVNVYQNGSATANPQILVTLKVGSTTGNGNITASPSALSFNFFSGTSPAQTQNLQVSNSSNLVLAVDSAATVSQGSGWLTVTPGMVILSATMSSNFVVTVNPSGMSPGTYNGNIALTVTNQPVINIPVTMMIGSNITSELMASPSPLTFNVPAGGSATAYNQMLNVSTTAFGTVSFSASASTMSGGSWLSVNPPGVVSLTRTTPAVVTVSVNPTGLVNGQTYSGTVTLTPSDFSTAQVVQVTVTVGSAPMLTVAPAVLTFAYQTGTASPPAQNVSLTSSGSALAFSASPSTTSGGNWLVVSPQSGATPASGAGMANVSVQVNPTGLAPGNYSGTVKITAGSASNPSQSIPVNLLVTNLPILTVSNSSFTFNYQYGSTTLPVQQQLQVTSSGNPLNFTVATAPSSGGNFLMVTPTSGTTPAALNLSINPSVLVNLPHGTYSESVTVSAVGAGNSPVNLIAYLIVGDNNLLTLSQTAFVFNYQQGKALPPIQTLSVTSNGSPISYTVAATSSNCGGNFLSASPATGMTPGTVAIAVSASGVPIGTCKGTVTLTSTSANVGNTPLNIPVTFNLSNTPLLNVSPQAVNLTTQSGTNPANQIISLTSTDPTVPLMFNVTSTTNNGSAWLLVGPTSGSTPNNLTLGFQTAGLGVGTYTGSVTVTPATAGGTPTVIPVTVVVTSGNTATATPATLTFNQPYGGSAPAAQTVQIASATAGLNFSTSTTVYTPSGGTWLSVTPATGTTNGSISVSVNGSNLAQGMYSGVVTVVIPGAANAPINIPVMLVIGPALSLTATPTSLTFSYTVGSGTPPAAQTVQLNSTSGAVPFAATTNSTTTGLISVTPSSGMTPASLSIGLNQSVLSKLAAGSYSGTVEVTSSSISGATLTINVVVTVQPMPPPTLTSVVSGASELAGAVSPGEIITIFGSNIGPTPALGLQLGSDGKVLTMLDDTQVTFDGNPAPLIYVSATQINAIVPYQIAGRTTTSVVVTHNSVATSAVMVNVADTAPAIFSLSQGGSGQGAILNQDSTVNGPSNAAAKGSIISIYSTGEGMLIPSGSTGSVTSSTAPFPVPVGKVSVTIGGLPATIDYAGEAPGLVSGVLQVNAVIPDGTASGSQPVVLTVGANNSAQQTITVAVK